MSFAVVCPYSWSSQKANAANQLLLSPFSTTVVLGVTPASDRSFANAFLSGMSRRTGSFSWNWQSQLNDPVRRDIPDKKAFAKLLSDAGVTPKTTVVLYGDNNNWFAAFAFWLLQLYGHTTAKLMNGGRAKWVTEGRPFVTERSAVRATNYPVPKKQNAAIRAKRPEIEKALKGKKTKLVDVRSTPEFVGEIIAPPGMTETARSEEHTSELQSRLHLVCSLL